MRDYISPEIKSYTSEEILELIGPAETQYTLTLGLQGAVGALPCGTTITDGDANDTVPAAGIIGFRFVNNDLPNETGYRWQADWSSPTFVNEDTGTELPANTTISEPAYGPGSAGTHAYRIFAHVGHAPGHGGTPIPGDVVSNECTVTLVFP